MSTPLSPAQTKAGKPAPEVRTDTQLKTQPTSAPRYPSLYQINARVWLTELSRALGRRATLDDIPDSALDEFAQKGFDWIWMLSIWQTGAAAQAVSRSNPEWRHEFQQTLPDLTEDDIGGSGFAIAGYTTHRDFGGDAALARLRARLRQHGLKLMLDFVPNHMAPDHPWVDEHPEYFVGGSDDDLARAPQNYFRLKTKKGSRVFAYGRDPYFAGWPDTIQLDYGKAALQTAMIGELSRIAGQCDGVRCDMAMLVLPEVFQRTWGISSQPFWPRAIPEVRQRAPEFVFMAEVYWDLEWTLQEQGFDYCYDKRLYDRLHEGHVRPVREHLFAGLDFQDRLARFLENHDEPRAAATFDFAKHRAAAIVTFLAPGLRFFHQGQFEGRLKRISPHLVRAPSEPTDSGLSKFYTRLLAALRLPAVRDGLWHLLDCRPAWDGNWTNDSLIAFGWEKSSTERLIAVVNYSDHQSQARVRLPFAVSDRERIQFEDLIEQKRYDWAGAELASQGLYVDLPAWGIHVFTLHAVR
jgi:glycosidase